jgi:hypothetical protein
VLDLAEALHGQSPHQCKNSFIYTLLGTVYKIRIETIGAVQPPEVYLLTNVPRQAAILSILLMLSVFILLNV